jgi:hypothetical protein
MKNRVLLENYLLPGDLERQIGVFVDHYYNSCYHESLQTLTPEDVYYVQGRKILKLRTEIKKTDTPETTLAAPIRCSLNSNRNCIRASVIKTPHHSEKH